MRPGNWFLRSIDNSRPGIFSRSRDAPISAILSGAKKLSSGCGIQDGPFIFWRMIPSSWPRPLTPRDGSHAARPDEAKRNPGQVYPPARYSPDFAWLHPAYAQILAHATRRKVTPPSGNESPDTLR